ncbi:tripartite tricarboxylate transporter substrate binding protein [Brevibacterium daeguense]|uniref:Tripartite tricarboxylate transporter substrate binding protein n=1 Tax=Brevibacterium daeguense TaxID=909936 RepID=A0ABP8EFH5_9MICO|nr:tripartite tricarboxylate transporter substrate binding protein [Brevibacterium daeguense]
MEIQKKARVLTAAATLIAAGVALSGCGNGGGESGGGGEFNPQGNVTMIVPFAAGGGSDIAGRSTAAGLEEVTGRTISVENIEGGSGAVGYSNFMGRQGDPNYLLATETSLVTLPLTQDVEYTYEDFTPIMKLGEDYTLIVAQADSELETCTDLTDQGSEGGAKVAIAGVGGLDDMTFSLMEEATGSTLDRVPFESGAELITALLGGEVDAISLNPGEVAGQLESGDLKALCAASEERYEYEMLADIPTAKEQGLDVALAQFRGFIAPGGISEEARDYWIEMGQQYAETEAYQTYIEDNMLQANTAFGDDFVSYLAENQKLVEPLLTE